jgi:hypothetical protein
MPFHFLLKGQEVKNNSPWGKIAIIVSFDATLIPSFI